MSRVQLSLNVSDLETAVAFYSRLFGTQPAKLRPGCVLLRQAGQGVGTRPGRAGLGVHTVLEHVETA